MLPPRTNGVSPPVKKAEKGSHIASCVWLYILHLGLGPSQQVCRAPGGLSDGC
jgi:hypothetical protein